MGLGRSGQPRLARGEYALVSDLWWQLPGPARFARVVENAFRDGRCAVVLTPRLHPEGLGRAVRGRIEVGGLRFRWTNRDGRRLGYKAPVEALYEQLVSEPPAEAYTLRGLAAEPELANRIVWIENLCDEQWPVWCRFLADYAEVLHARGTPDPPLFALVHAASEEAFPPQHLLLARFRWSGYVDLLDMQLYAASLLESDQRDRLRRDIAAMTIAALAQWDADLAHELAREEVKALFHPFEVLANYARERGWEESAVEGDWLAGTREMYGGRQCVHSALLAVAGDRREIERRLWRAQIGVLFPFLEEQRLALIESVRGELYAPYVPDDRYPNRFVECVADLELTHIREQLRPKQSQFSAQWLRTDRLKALRDALAHLKPVPYRDLDVVAPAG